MCVCVFAEGELKWTYYKEKRRESETGTSSIVSVELDYDCYLSETLSPCISIRKLNVH